MAAKRHVEMQCALNPEHITVLSNHHCHQWKREKRLWHRSPDVEEFVWGTPKDRRIEVLEEENAELKRLLARSREISRARLERLKGKEGG